MISLNKTKGVVGLDLEAGSIAATEVRENGSIAIAATGIAPLASGAVREGEVIDSDLLAESLKDLFAEHKLAKTVRLGIANQRIVVRTMRLPLIEDKNELETAIRFQAQDQIPMPLDQAVVEHQVVGRSTNEGGEASMEVIVVAARRDMISGFLRSLQGAGLKPVGIDLSAFGMIRALAGEEAVAEAGAPSYEERMANPDAAATGVSFATLYCNLGDVTNLAVARGQSCLFTRASQFGVEGIAQRLAERRGLTLEHARQWLGYVGLVAPVEEIEGEPDVVAATRDVLAEGASKLVDELRLSLEYYGHLEGVPAVERVVACGTGTTIPGLTERIERELGQPVSAARPGALGHLDPASAARLTLSYGLAVEG